MDDVEFEKIDCSQSPSATKVIAIYYASVEDSAIVACFLVLHIMAPPTKVKTNLDVDLDVDFFIVFFLGFDVPRHCLTGVPSVVCRPKM